MDKTHNKPTTQQTPSINSDTKKKQTQLLFILFVIILIGGFNFYLAMKTPSRKSFRETTKKAHFVSPVDDVNDESIWMQRAEKEIKDEQGRNDVLTKQLKNQKDLLKAQAQIADSQKKNFDVFQKQFNDLKDRVQRETPSNKNSEKKSLPNTEGRNHFSSPIKTSSEFPPKGAKTRMGTNSNNHFPTNNTAGNGAGQGTAEEFIQSDEIHLIEPIDNTPHKNPDTYVPSGAFVRAVMLSGLDAPTSVNNQGEPVPVLLRLVDWGTLPNKAHSHLKNCFITGAGIGKISSERAYIRLETFSCTKTNGEIIDMPVKGTVVGPDGKDGIRGNVISRDTKLLWAAGMAGALSGFSKGLGQAFTTQSINPLGSVRSVNNSDLFKYGAASGAESAMDKLADYNIKRAENIQPVIEVSAGISVDVLFLQGFYLDGNDGKTFAKQKKEQSNLYHSTDKRSKLYEK